MIVFTVALMPIIGGGATQMFNAETPGITHERFRPRVTQVAKRLWGVYLFPDHYPYWSFMGGSNGLV